MTFAQIITSSGIIIAGFWALIIYVNERGSITAVEFDVECELVGETEKNKIIEITTVVDNKGPLILVADSIHLRLRAINRLDSTKELSLFESGTDQEVNKLGRLKFPHVRTRNPENKNKIKLLPIKTFVKPGVRQKYSFVTAVDKDDVFLFAHAELTYGKSKQTWWQYLILTLCRFMGLRKHVIKDLLWSHPQTVERAFNLETTSK